MSRIRALSSVLASTGRLCLDALLDWHPGTLPMAAEKVVTVSFLNSLLHQHGFNEQARQAQVRAVKALDIQSVSSNCNNIVIEVEWEPGNNMPDTLFLKLPCPEFTTRWFCNVIRVWELECNFFRNFAGDFPVRLPQVYALATHRSRFILLQENLHADASVQLFTNPDMLAGPTDDVVRGCLAAFARVHGHFNNLPAAEQERRLPRASHPFLSPVMTEISRFINVAAIGPCQRKAPGQFPEHIADTYRLAMQHWDELLDWWYREPLTLIHGDSHLGNFFVDGTDMGMLDFQAAQWGKGIRDVQYFLIDSVPPERLALHEREWVDYYVTELARNGQQLSSTDAWEQYRAYSFQTLMTIVVSLGLGPLTEKDSLMEEILQRAVAAVERLDFRGWLTRTIIQRHPQ
jgi:hypothetical protein